MLALATCALALALTASAGAARFLVVYKDRAVPDGAGAEVRRAGGSVVARYDAIGVVVAESSEAGFAARIRSDARIVDLVARVETSDAPAEQAVEAAGPPAGELANAPAEDEDNLSPLQWNMRQIKAPEAHELTGGSPAVRVALIDTGIDYLHPDLAQNVDFDDSVSCLGGAPTSDPAAWRDDNGHGTHNAGTIAAASNGIGIVGVAPNVRLAAVKAGNAQNRFTPEAVVCALMWAADRGLDVANESFTVDKPDPADALDFWCRSDPADRAVIKAVQRASMYAHRHGVTMVASAGNSNLDVAHAPVDGDCIRLPSELPGVVVATADGQHRAKAFYSNYGVGFADVVAPGGDLTQFTPQSPNGRVLSTWPTNIASPAPPFFLRDPDNPSATYQYMTGTSVSAAHVSGVAALLVSRFGELEGPEDALMRPGRVAAYLEQTALPLACPPNPYTVVVMTPGGPMTFTATCQGGEGYNAFYGHGEIDALAAVTHEPSP